MRKAILAVVLIAGSLSLVGCQPTAPIPTPSPADIVGTWRHGSDIITINRGGTFAVSGMPKGVIEQAEVSAGSAPSGPGESITGTWSVGSGGTDVGGAPGVQLTFVNPPKIGYNYGLTLVVAAADPLQLYVTLGRPDSGVRYTFSRE